jgi:hypothetical protein
MERNSHYLPYHQPRDGHVVCTQEEVEGLIADAKEIQRHVLDLFTRKYGEI